MMSARQRRALVNLGDAQGRRGQRLTVATVIALPLKVPAMRLRGLVVTETEIGWLFRQRQRLARWLAGIFLAVGLWLVRFPDQHLVRAIDDFGRWLVRLVMRASMRSAVTFHLRVVRRGKAGGVEIATTASSMFREGNGYDLDTVLREGDTVEARLRFHRPARWQAILECEYVHEQAIAWKGNI